MAVVHEFFNSLGFGEITDDDSKLIQEMADANGVFFFRSSPYLISDFQNTDFLRGQMVTKGKHCDSMNYSQAHPFV